MMTKGAKLFLAAVALVALAVGLTIHRTGEKREEALGRLRSEAFALGLVEFAIVDDEPKTLIDYQAQLTRTDQAERDAIEAGVEGWEAAEARGEAIREGLHVRERIARGSLTTSP